jgi:hypothetical protein
MYGFAARLAYKKEYFTGICVNNHLSGGGGGCLAPQLKVLIVGAASSRDTRSVIYEKI